MDEPSIFIGSSSENHDLTQELASYLHAAGVKTVPWYDAFTAGFAALEELAKRITEVDFAAFFLVADDAVMSRDREYTAPRDNIVFELGLFMGRLNRDRTFALVDPSNMPHMFSDFAGVTYVEFNPEDVEALATRLASRIFELGGLARIPRNTHLVARGATGRNAYEEISSAVQAAEAGDVILVRPGVYHEPLFLDKPLEIIGVGAMSEHEGAIIRTDADSAITYAAQGGHGRVASLKIEANGPENAVVDVVDGMLLIRGCTITAHGEIAACVRVRGDGSASIDWNDISDSDGIGILVCEAGFADIRDNQIRSHSHTCVEVRDGVQPRVQANRISNGRAGGIWFHRGSRGFVTRNDIYENAMAGISITDRADPEITGNRVHHGYSDGVSVGTDGRGEVSENDVYANAGTGVYIADGAEPFIGSNRIYDGQGGGIVVQGGARPRITHNLVRANQRAGVAIMAEAQLLAFSGNTVIDGSDAGIYDEIGIPEADNQVLRNSAGDWVRPGGRDLR